MLIPRAFALLFCLAVLAGAARAEDAFYRVPLADLKLTDGQFPDPSKYRSDWRWNWRTRQRPEVMQSRAVLDGEGEVYFEDENRSRWWAPAPMPNEGIIAVRDEARQALQALSWGNLPILNEWRRRWPDRDPVELHEEFWLPIRRRN